MLLADHVGCQLDSQALLDPLGLLVTGPGGTGKSRIFEAWTEFHSLLDIAYQLRLTGPTGVVASDIGGSTTHAEVSLCVARSNMKATTPQGRKLREALEKRLTGVRTLVVDEIYFLGASDVSILSEYCSLAKGITEYPFGRMNIVTCGDPCQLPPPQAKTLFDRELVRCYSSGALNAGNEGTQYNVKGIQAWHQVSNVVVLDEIMRQKGDDVLIDLLGRLRRGTCTEEDKCLLDGYVLSSDDCGEDTKDLPNIRHWIKGVGCPLIVYCNEARDIHNFEMSCAFSRATGQESFVYFSIDTRGRGKAKRELVGVAAEAAWRVAVKEADDLSGKLPLVSGMPVFCTENIATELRISKGCMGKLVSVKYVERSGCRYAVSVEVDFPGYQGKDPLHPHRTLLSTVTRTIHFKLPTSDTVYSASRHQLPLIPAFAFTSHNSQGRSLEKACIDLASCVSIQSAYVMVSRLKSRKGLCILRPFNLSVIQKHVSEEIRNEMTRTSKLETQTLLAWKSRLSWYYNSHDSTIFDSVNGAQ